jgi:hypothetical protein
LGGYFAAIYRAARIIDEPNRGKQRNSSASDDARKCAASSKSASARLSSKLPICQRIRQARFR